GHALTTASARRYRYTTHIFFTEQPPTAIYTLSLHDALPIYRAGREVPQELPVANPGADGDRLADTDADAETDGDAEIGGHQHDRSEEHTSELQSRFDLVCRLLLEKKKRDKNGHRATTMIPAW